MKRWGVHALAIALVAPVGCDANERSPVPLPSDRPVLDPEERCVELARPTVFAEEPGLVVIDLLADGDGGNGFWAAVRTADGAVEVRRAPGEGPPSHGPFDLGPFTSESAEEVYLAPGRVPGEAWLFRNGAEIRLWRFDAFGGWVGTSIDFRQQQFGTVLAPVVSGQGDSLELIEVPFVADQWDFTFLVVGDDPVLLVSQPSSPGPVLNFPFTVLDEELEPVGLVDYPLQLAVPIESVLRRVERRDVSALPGAAKAVALYESVRTSDSAISESDQGAGTVTDILPFRLLPGPSGPVPATTQFFVPVSSEVGSGTPPPLAASLAIDPFTTWFFTDAGSLSSSVYWLDDLANEFSVVEGGDPLLDSTSTLVQLPQESVVVTLGGTGNRMELSSLRRDAEGTGRLGEARTIYEDPDLLNFEAAGVGHLLVRRNGVSPALLRLRCTPDANDPTLPLTPP